MPICHAGHFDNPTNLVLGYSGYLRLGSEKLWWDPTTPAKLPALLIGTRVFYEDRQQLLLYRELESQLQAAARCRPATMTETTPPAASSRLRFSSGSGFFLSLNGLAGTSAHVVAGAKTIRVTRAPRNNYGGATVGMHVFAHGYRVTDILGNEPKFKDVSISALSGIGGK